MKKTMDISEKDLFYYVFFNTELDEQKKTEIKSNKYFKQIISFYESLKSELELKVSAQEKISIAKIIPAYKAEIVVELFPLKEKKSIYGNFPILAAASAETDFKVNSQTFFDEENDYLIRLLNFQDSSRIYVFSITDQVLKNYKVILHPSEESYTQKDNSVPLEINNVSHVESIELQFL